MTEILFSVDHASPTSTNTLFPTGIFRLWSIPRANFVLAATLTLAVISFPYETVVAEVQAQRIKFLNYPNCIELRNPLTRVVLCPDAGGRVLVYETLDKNSLYLDASEKDWKSDFSKRVSMSAGRFDIGPEKTIPRHPVLWSGEWEGQITDRLSARLISRKDHATGVQLVREFTLDPESTRLECAQTIRNVSNVATEWCHWSRTFAVGHGICIIPLSPISRFPSHYVMYENGDLINIRPTDPNIRVRENFLEILDVPREPKLGMDSARGWFAYLMPNDLVFVKRFTVDRQRVYNEVAGLTISIWYPEGERVELEPIGPRERLEPGDAATFTETWYLLPYEFPVDRRAVDLNALSSFVEQRTNSPKKGPN